MLENKAELQLGVSLLENKAELQSVEIAILIGQLQSDRAF